VEASYLELGIAGREVAVCALAECVPIAPGNSDQELAGRIAVGEAVSETEEEGSAGYSVP